MGIKTLPHPPYSPDLAPCDFWLFPKLRGCRYETTEEMKEAVTKSHWHAHTSGLPLGLPEVVGTVQQVHCSQRRLLWRGLEFHVCTINKSAHTKKMSRNLWFVNTFCRYTIKWSNSSGSNNLIQHKSTKLNNSKYFNVSLTIQLNISHLLCTQLISSISKNSI